MKKALLVLSFVFCAFSVANAAEFVDKPTAVVRIMNKAASKAKTITIPVGKDTEFEKLSITVRACKTTVPYAALDNFMFIEVTKKSAPDTNPIFSGWMTASDPGDNPLQDADYDLWLIGCE